MAQSTSSVGQGSNIKVTVVRVLTHSRNMEIWFNWGLVEMSDGSQKARCKYCGMLLAKESNSSLKKNILPNHFARHWRMTRKANKHKLVAMVEYSTST
ncbi:hypothetical protein R6Q59_015877 [Mikania micrantha]